MSPSASKLPMICLVHVWPPSNETPSTSPADRGSEIAIATTLFGFVGFTATASSASLPARTLTSTFVGATVAAVGGTATATTTARARTASRTANRVSGRDRCMSPLSVVAVGATVEDSCYLQRSEIRVAGSSSTVTLLRRDGLESRLRPLGHDTDLAMLPLACGLITSRAAKWGRLPE